MKIDKIGCLVLTRKGVDTEIYCPRQDGNARCGSWCALFGEPTNIEDGRVSINICETVWETEPGEVFIDER